MSAQWVACVAGDELDLELIEHRRFGNGFVFRFAKANNGVAAYRHLNWSPSRPVDHLGAGQQVIQCLTLGKEQDTSHIGQRQDPNQ